MTSLSSPKRKQQRPNGRAGVASVEVDASAGAGAASSHSGLGNKATLEDIYNPNGTIQGLFGDLNGLLLETAIFAMFGEDGHTDIPWYSDAKCSLRAIVRHPLNREIQETVCENYKNKMLTDGFSQDVSGAYAPTKFESL